MRPKTPKLDQDAAETLGLQALGFLASDPSRLTRFLTLTGLDTSSLRDAAATPGILAAVLGHLLGDETLLLVFAEETRIPPERVSEAEAVLTGEPLTQRPW